MIDKTIKEIAEMIHIHNEITTFQNKMIHGVCIDTRKLQKGNLFIPFKGSNVDGHQYVEEAIKQGAAAALWQKDVPHPPTHLPILIVDNTLTALQQLARSYRSELPCEVIGITGSNGKTTTKDMTASVLEEHFKVQKTEGNLNNHIGLPLTILSIKKETEVAIVEMGMSAMKEISLLTNIAKPDIAMITNIGEAHLLDLGSRGAIATAKLEIVEGLKENGTLIYHGDEPLLTEKVKQLTSVQSITFGETAANDVYPTKIKQTSNGSSFTINIMPEEQFEIPILGRHNVLNALTAIIVATQLNTPLEAIKAGLQSFQLSDMRMEWVKGKKDVNILNDAYNASPTAMRAVIELVEDLDHPSAKIVVLGDMLELGENEKEFHQQIGRELNPNKIKYVFTYGHLSQALAEGAKEHFPSERIFSFVDKKELIHTLKEIIQGNEIILVKASRGMKMEEVVEALS